MSARSSRPGPTGDLSARSSTPRLRGARLAAARAAWTAVASLAAALSVAGLPALYGEFRTLSVYDPGVRDDIRTNLAEIGLSAGFYAAYLLTLGFVLALVCFAVAVVIFWRRSEEPMALFVALLLVLLGATFSGSIGAMETHHPIWGWLNNVLNACSLATVFLFFYLFPDGRFVPHWTRWLAVLIVAYVALTALFPGYPLSPENWPALPYTLLLGTWLLTGVFAQAYRYWRVSGPIPRQQTKWVVFGFSAALTGYLMVISLQVVFPSLQPGTLADFLGAAVASSFMLLIPLSFGFAVLRYKLYDIDVVIHRTLVYGSLTAALAGVYFGSIVVLQWLLVALTGEKSTLAVVASTLAIAALFSPIRRRIQRFIDRRFYRRKYDVRKTLESFSEKVRDETDLDRLGAHLTGVVRESMQPSRLSLWLSPSTPPPKGERGDCQSPRLPK
jgi:hypothetical protein